MAKLFVSETHARQVTGAVRIHGGYGYATEMGLERELRDAIPGTTGSSTAGAQGKVTARLLGT